MSEIKISGKKTITGQVLSASQVPCILLGKDAYNTANEMLDMHRKAKAGVEVINKKVFSKNALLRGAYLEHAIVPWYLHTLKDEGIEAKTEEPKKAFILEDIKLGATLDRIIKLSKGSELTIGDNTFTGKGCMEVKTDWYHKDFKMEWKIQLNTQMICSGLEWGIVVCLDGQAGKLKVWGFHKDEKLCQIIIEACKQFWTIVDDPEDSYPEPEPEQEDQPKVMVVEPQQDNLNLDVVINDYKKASAEAASWTKLKKENQELLELHMDGIGAEIMIVGNHSVQATTKSVPKKKYVEVPGEYTTRSTFKISTKEETDE